MRCVNTNEAVGLVLCHELTQILPAGCGARFKAGHVIEERDIPVLLSMGRERLYVVDGEEWNAAGGRVPVKEGTLHENEAAARLAALCLGEGMSAGLPEQGRAAITAERDGLFSVNLSTLYEINSVDDLSIATRASGTPVKKGDLLAVARINPLTVAKNKLELAAMMAGKKPLLSVEPYTLKTAGVIATGNELVKGRVEDACTPAVKEKLAAFGITVIAEAQAEDNVDKISEAIEKMREQGAQLVILTGGMSVDPDDRTAASIHASRVQTVAYGMPILPGGPMLLGYFEDGAPVLGLPSCVLRHKQTAFDKLLPYIAAGVEVTREQINEWANGGLLEP